MSVKGDLAWALAEEEWLKGSLLGAGKLPNRLSCFSQNKSNSMMPVINHFKVVNLVH